MGLTFYVGLEDALEGDGQELRVAEERVGVLRGVLGVVVLDLERHARFEIPTGPEGPCVAPFHGRHRVFFGGVGRVGQHRGDRSDGGGEPVSGAEQGVFVDGFVGLVRVLLEAVDFGADDDIFPIKVGRQAADARELVVGDDGFRGSAHGVLPNVVMVDHLHRPDFEGAVGYRGVGAEHVFPSDVRGGRVVDLGGVGVIVLLARTEPSVGREGPSGIADVLGVADVGAVVGVDGPTVDVSWRARPRVGIVDVEEV